MEGRVRISGVETIGNISWGTHFCQFYKTKEDLMDVVVPYFKAGLENDEFCMWVTSQLLDVEEAKEALVKGVPDFDVYLQRGQMEIISYDNWYARYYISDSSNPIRNGLEKLNQKIAKDYDGLRLSGDFFLLEERRQDFAYREGEIDSVISKYRMITMCTYSFEKCNVAGIAEIVSNHQFILAKKEGKWERIENSGRKRAEEAESRLKGVLDNLENLVKARTAELEKTYNSLKENEMRLSEAQKIAHIGSWDWNLVTGEVYWSDELYRIFGLAPRKFGLPYNEILDYIHPEDRKYADTAIKRSLNGEPYEIDYRIITADGAELIVHAQGGAVFDENNNPVFMSGTIQDITERKRAEKELEKIQETHIKEIHHRIKNNLQVISSLLSLQAERFSDEKVLEAFRESQNRVASMALIHEELYTGNKITTLDFADYLQKLAVDLFSSYNLRNDNIKLKLDLEQIYLGMDTAIPLGIIVNELVSNSLKHAFPDRREGEISIALKRAEKFTVNGKCFKLENGCTEENFNYVLAVSDNGISIPEGTDFRTADSLGFQLINILVEQIDGCIELRKDKGTEFIVSICKIEKMSK
ncbi:sensory transduction histidine kinase [Methanosarcina horonobensis HB-1 = JCM 15518]|uniref:Sensory transduction histidine kinase n=1 Tax=Methanosarcina horonobensis HB-1 = JCM 15518 TaxID=1434110 RepID=A0A0E3WVQ4_9EURY|nr:MEDS domain-containing protein [Methanosarcina horonobensis]AKB78225.1 sensory transduction histidine kinase [Methanosarcina horonobensis HB-1 = JCM 15518]